MFYYTLFHFLSSWVLTICLSADPSLWWICPLISFVIFKNSDVVFPVELVCVCLGLWKWFWWFVSAGHTKPRPTDFQLADSHIMYEIKIWRAPAQNMCLGFSFSWGTTPTSTHTPKSPGNSFLATSQQW